MKGQTINALDQINLEIPEGSICIISYSGAGKSTLIRLINLLETPIRGTGNYQSERFYCNGCAYASSRTAKYRHDLSTFQFLLQTKTVSKTIEMPLKLLGHNKADRESA